MHFMSRIVLVIRLSRSIMWHYFWTCWLGTET